LLPSKDIDGNLYETDLFKTIPGLGILIDLKKVVGPGVIAALEGGADEFKNISLADVAKHLTESMNKENTIDLIKRLLETTRKDGKPLTDDFDLFFRGKYHILGKVILFVIQENFFLGKDIIALLKKQFDQKSDSPQNLTPTVESSP